jgi:hypothetical protein
MGGKMKLIKALVVFFLFVFWSSYLSAYEKFTGSVSGSVVEENGHVFTGGQGFKESGEFEDKQVVYFRQERGQKISMTKTNIVFDASKENKYQMVVEITERQGDKFKALVSFYQNQVSQENGDFKVVSKLIKKSAVEGMLNSKNDYLFVDDNQPNLKAEINIDRVFSKQEIMNKLANKISPKEQLANERVGQ